MAHSKCEAAVSDSVGPLSSSELNEVRAITLAPSFTEYVTLPKSTVVRLLAMLDARDGIIRGLCAEMDRFDVAVAETLKAWDAP